jgi:hypothetical protein
MNRFFAEAMRYIPLIITLLMTGWLASIGDATASAFFGFASLVLIVAIY